MVLCLVHLAGFRLNQAHGQRSRWKAQGCPSGFGQRLPALPL